MTRRSPRRRGSRESGQSAVEFLLVAPLILVLMMGALQFALLYRAKLTMNLATFEAARAGAVDHASYASIEAGFSRSMAAFYVPAAGAEDFPVGDVLDRAEFVAAARGNLPWSESDPNQGGVPVCFERLNPPEEAFDAFVYEEADDDAPDELPNDNLMFRDQRISVASGELTIQDANLLQLRISYCHPMIVPIAGRLISSVLLFGDPALGGGDANAADELTDYLVPEEGAGASSFSGFRKACLEGELTEGASYGFPLVSESIVRMHSNPRRDEAFSDPDCT